MRKGKRGRSEKIVFVTKNAQETKKTAYMLAQEILKKKPDLPASLRSPRSRVGAGGRNGPHALVIGLVGELGSGKTTFAQGFAHGLGIKESVLSPTFVLMRQYTLQKKIFKTFIHIDCYRVENPQELIALGWHDLIADPANLILIEWADRVADFFPPAHIILSFRHTNETTRTISVTETKKA